MVGVVDISAVIALVALALEVELACEYLMWLVVSSILGPLPLVAVIVAVAFVALPLGTSIGLLAVRGLRLTLVRCRIRHRLRPGSSIGLLGLSGKCKWKWRKSSR